VQLIAHGTVEVRREEAGVRVLSGEVEVSVAKVRAGAAPVRLLVSGGAIEVRGTRFTIHQRPESGDVTLHEGAIAFFALDGRVRELKPGETLEWPLPEVKQPPAPEPPPVPAHEAPHPKAEAPPARPAEGHAAEPQPTPPLDTEAFIAKLAELRRAGDYDAAVRELEAALEQPSPAPTQERLSFELGSILTHHIKDTARACAHWSRHHARYPQGRYEPQIGDIERRLGCQP
jgi:transmembrane sensor